MDVDRTRGLERKIVTVLFADLVGFTSLSEGLDPEDVSTVQDAYFDAVRETMGRYGGRLEKFIGDAAMAVFGVPLARDDDAERAVRAGLALAGAVEHIGAGFGLPDGALRLRVGVNSGEVAVHPEATVEEGMVTGDVVNVAARFQAAAAPGGVVVGENTALAVADAIDLVSLGLLELKGKAEAVPAWRAVGVLPERSRDRAMGSLRAPIMGRDQELELLEGALDRAAGGASELWVVVAAPGVGKTRLVDEVARRAASKDGPVLRARLRPDVIGPFQAVAQMVTSALRGAGLDLRDAANASERQAAARRFLLERLAARGASAARAEVVAHETVAVTWPDQIAAGPAGSAVDRQARFADWKEAVDALTGSGPVLWIVEDLHWGGGDLLAFMDFAHAEPGGRVIVGTTRPSLLERAEDWCRERPEAGRRLLHLPQLSTPHAGDLVRALVGGALDPPVVSRIVERSDGNPLFIEELLRTWVSVGVLVEEEGEWRMAASPGDVQIPTTVQSIYAAQIDDLPATARLAARRASVAGRRFPTAALEPLEVPDAAEAVDVLSRRALVTGPEPDPFAGPTYSFRHALLRDAGYASLARAERARLHIRLARWIEEVAGDRAAAVSEVVAGHYAAALESAPALTREVGDGLGRDEAGELAARWFERAGDAALAIAAHDAARTLLRRALDLTAEAEVLDRARRWERLGEATAFNADMEQGSGMLQQAIDLYREAMADADRPEDERSAARGGLARATGTLGQAFDQQLRFHDALAMADATLNEIGEAEDAATGTLLLLRAVQTLHTTDTSETIEGPERDLRRAFDIGRAAGDRGLELDATEWLTIIRSERGEDVRPEWQRIHELSVREARWARAVDALRMQAMGLTDDHAAETWSILDQATELAEAHGLTERLAWLDYERTEAGLVSGRWDLALETGLRAIELGERNAYHRPVVRNWFTLLPIAQARGMQQLVERIHRWFKEHKPPATAPWQLMMVAGAQLRFADAGLMPPFVPEPEPRLPAFSEMQGRPSWFATAERVATSWLEDGRLDAVRAALDAMAATPRLPSLGLGIERLLRSRLHAEEEHQPQSTAAAREALDAFRVSSALWWMAKTIRQLERAGDASPEERTEAARIERELGRAGPAV
jgi:class 3 adenylate cyclase/tetratricopeptide (TPR) repeat protein